MNLPRLLYVGPAIEPTVGGSALIYKLLKSYPRASVVSVEMQLSGLKPTNKLGFRTLRIPRPLAFLGPRGQTLFDLGTLFGRHFLGEWLNWKLRDYPFEVVVAVTHGWLCEAGLVLARKRQVPFCVIVHDHAENTLPVPRRLNGHRQRRWERLCREADSCLCVSPYMAEAVNQAGAKASTVLYPGLAPEADLATWPASPQLEEKTQLTFSYIGTLHGGYQELIRTCGGILHEAGHRMRLHCPGAIDFVRSEAPGLIDGGWLPTDAVAKTLRQEADALFLPMSFDQAAEPNMRVSFPSKLVEYCAAGRPVLVWGPPYCSAVRWANAHPGFAEVVESRSKAAVAAAVQRLENARRRAVMGHKSLELARQFFSHAKTFGTFVEAVNAGRRK